jgi:hypothetical protein
MVTLTAVLGVIALTVWASVATGTFHGPWAVLAGAVLTALAAVAAGYVPLIRDGVLRRRGELERLEAEEAADQLALHQAGELPGQSPAGLLDPRRGLVGFTGREEELAGLLGWCLDPARRGVRLVTGPGGVGKTRLSVEVSGGTGWPSPSRRCGSWWPGRADRSRWRRRCRRSWPTRIWWRRRCRCSRRRWACRRRGGPRLVNIILPVQRSVLDRRLDGQA